MDTNLQGFKFFRDNALRHNPTHLRREKPHTAVLRECVDGEAHSSPIEGRSALIAALNPSVVDGTTTNTSPFSWAVRLPGQNSRNHARNVGASLNPVVKIGVLSGRSPRKQNLITWACTMVQSGLSVRGSNMSLDMRLFDVPDERAGSDRSDPIAVGLSDPLA